MTSPPVGTKVSSCVDCATPIIGEIQRCGACRDRHATRLLAGDEDVTLPHDRSLRSASIGQVLLTWFVFAQLVTSIVILLLLAGRGCL